MSKYIFLNIPAYGHINPTLPIAQELVRRGEQVVYYLTDEFRGAVEATGAVFHSYQSLMGAKPFQAAKPMMGRDTIGPGAIFLILADESRQVLPQVLESIAAEQPDYILYNPLCLWGRIASQALQKQSILLLSSHASNEHFNYFMVRGETYQEFSPELLEQVQADYTNLCATYNVPPIHFSQFFTHAEALNIVFLPRIFQPAGETFDKRFVFVGPSFLPPQNTATFPFDLLESQPVLYISLGTIFNDRPDFFQLCFQAFAGQPWQVVLSHGKHIDATTLGPVPANFFLFPHVPQLEVLQRARLFVTHGGMNSVMESISYGVPMVVIPQMIEQEITSHSIEELGLGKALSQKNLTAQRLREAVIHVQQDLTIAPRMQNIQQAVHAAGGYQRAADAILEFSRQ